jgi:cyclic pyranopterin phosphate synthase
MTPTILTDSHGRRIDYLRLSVTDRCDLRCGYCLPKGTKSFEEPADWLTFDEIIRVVDAFITLGVQRVRLTGGEPLMRRGLPELAAGLAALPGLADLSLSRNCNQMKAQAVPLFRAGVRRLNLSLDSLRPERFAQLTGGGRLSQVMAGVMAAKDAGFAPIKVNTVAMRGINEDEFPDILAFCTEHGFTLRLIETMPMGSAGREARRDYYLDLEGVRRRLPVHFDLIPDLMPGGGPARYYRVAGSATRIGFITPLSRHFCATCNRVRLGVDGTLHLCLGQAHRVPLRPLLRAGATAAELAGQLRAAVSLKPEGHRFDDQSEPTLRCMAATGG